MNKLVTLVAFVVAVIQSVVLLMILSNTLESFNLMVHSFTIDNKAVPSVVKRYWVFVVQLTLV